MKRETLLRTLKNSNSAPTHRAKPNDYSMNTSFTKGPWYLVPHDSCSAMYITHSRKRMDEVAVVYNAEEGSVGLADAHLIAAAPELFEALQKLVADADYCAGDRMASMNDANVELARAALAKAQPPRATPQKET